MAECIKTNGGGEGLPEKDKSKAEKYLIKEMKDHCRLQHGEYRQGKEVPFHFFIVSDSGKDTVEETIESFFEEGKQGFDMKRQRGWNGDTPKVPGCSSSSSPSATMSILPSR